MRRILLLMITVMMSLVSLAQQKDVTKFLGIPVDGTVAAMRQKLIVKGFKPTQLANNVLQGKFNGANVYVSLVDNKGKLWRVAVVDKDRTDEINIRIRFNNLCGQFLRNAKYAPLLEDCTIPDDTNIMYEMTVKKKRFEAAFWQASKEEIGKTVRQALLENFSEEQINHPTEEEQKLILDFIQNQDFAYMKKNVWFVICEQYGEYFIDLFYDNVYNQGDGEDL